MRQAPELDLEYPCGRHQIKLSKECLKNKETGKEAASQKKNVTARAAREL